MASIEQGQGADRAYPNRESMRNLIDDKGGAGAKLVGTVQSAVLQKTEPSSSPGKVRASKLVPLGNFKKMLTISLRKSANAVMEDGDFITIVRKGAKEIINAIHRTSDTIEFERYREQLATCNKLLGDLHTKLFLFIKQIPKQDKARRKEALEIDRVVESVLHQLVKEAACNPTIVRTNPQVVQETACDPTTIITNLQTEPERLFELVKPSNFDRIRNNEAVVAQLAVKLREGGEGVKQLILDTIKKSEKPAIDYFKLLELLHDCGLTFSDMMSDSWELSALFIDLLFENPKYTLALLQNPKYKINEVALDYGHTYQFGSAAARGIAKDAEESFASCVDELVQNPSFKAEQLAYQLRQFIEDDMPAVCHALAQCLQSNYNTMDALKVVVSGDTSDEVVRAVKIAREKDTLLKIALHNDHAACFGKFFELWRANPVCSESEMIQLACEYSAPRCLQYLFEHLAVKDAEKALVAAQAARDGYAEIVLVACDGNTQKAAEQLFSTVTPLLNHAPVNAKAIQTEVYDQVIKILRFTPIEVTERIVQAFLRQYPLQRQILAETYESAKSHFLHIAPFISRYTRRDDLVASHRNYADKSVGPDKSISSTVANDMEYAAFCRKQVEGLLESLQLKTLKKPSSEPFTRLSPSKYKTRRVAALLEKISQIRTQTQNARVEKSTTYMEFAIVRGLDPLDRDSRGVTTPVFGRYAWARPLITTVSRLSKAADVFRKQDGTYWLSYADKDSGLAQVSCIKWNHGLQPINKTWSSIEDVFEEAMELDLTKPLQNTPQAIKKYQNELTKLYSKVCELVWLIGNSTPLLRGSGTVAEWLLAIVFIQHGLEPPLLKTEFPQLDVLDITFPLSDYKRLFPYFFEPSTIPEHLRRPAMSQQSLPAQMKALYASL